MRIIDSLAQQVMEASDEELAEVAKGLRMDLNSDDSAAFAGLTHFAQPQLSDFFDLNVCKSLHGPAEGLADNPPAQPKDCKRQSKRPQNASAIKRPTK